MNDLLGKESLKEEETRKKEERVMVEKKSKEKFLTEQSHQSHPSGSC